MQNTAEDGKYNGMSYTLFLKVIQLSCGQEQATLAGLDNVSHRYGHENFDKMRDTSAKLLNYADCFGLDTAGFANLQESISAFQAFAKSDMLSHLQPHSTVGIHCLCRLLGGQEHVYGSTCGACSKATMKAMAAAAKAAKSVANHSQPSSIPEAVTCKECATRRCFSSDCPAECSGHPDHCEMCDMQFVIPANMRALLQMMKAPTVSTYLCLQLCAAVYICTWLCVCR
jgi:hypothetical protein